MSFVVTAVAATAYMIYSGERAAREQEHAQQVAEANAREQARLADIAQGKANQKRPKIAQALADAQTSGAAGVSGTMLTGPQGITSGVPLGGNTLLGM